MNVSILPSTQAWTVGAKMWVVPLPAHSLWSRKIDWYLNFRMTKGQAHQSKQRPVALEGLLKSVAWKLPADIEIEQDPLLIASSLRLPCDWVLLLKDFETDKKKFAGCLTTLSKVWMQMNQPRIRLFAPSEFDRELLTDNWSEQELPEEFEFILE